MLRLKTAELRGFNKLGQLLSVTCPLVCRDGVYKYKGRQYTHYLFTKYGHHIVRLAISYKCS